MLLTTRFFEVTKFTIPTPLPALSSRRLLWVTAGLLANDNYSTPKVNNIYCSSSSCTGIDIQRVLERCALVFQAEVH